MAIKSSGVSAVLIAVALAGCSLNTPTEPSAAAPMAVGSLSATGAQSTGFIGRFDGVSDDRIAALATPPTDLIVFVNGTTVTLNWRASSGDPVTYIIEAGTGPGLANLANFATGGLATTFTAANVPAGTYYVRVRARSADGTSGPSNEVAVVVGGAPCPLPRTPFGLTAVVNQSSITLSWGTWSEATSHQLEVGSAPGLADLFNGDIGRRSSLTVAVSPGTYFFRIRGTSACGPSAPSNEAMARVGGTVTIIFANLAASGSPFSNYAESGYTISSTSASWITASYGNPGPAIQFSGAAGQTTVGEIRVTAGGASFSFNSVDLYSSTTQIPYVLTGFRSAATMFTAYGTVPNTYGRFANVASPNASAIIDTLVIRLSNMAAPCCSNPMGIDNIVLTPR